MERTRTEFHVLLGHASPEDLRRGSRGTRWTNEELLFHMLFGYLVVRTLLRLVRAFGRLPDSISRIYSRMLNGANRPFHLINYWGSRGGALLCGRDRMGRWMDRVIDSLQHHLDRDSDATLALKMHFPTRWDPFFTDVMTLADVYHYATQHFDYHRHQLTLTAQN
jgi:hypothetical protein